MTENNIKSDITATEKNVTAIDNVMVIRTAAHFARPLYSTIPDIYYSFIKSLSLSGKSSEM